MHRKVNPVGSARAASPVSFRFRSARRERGDRGRLKAGRTHNCDSAGTTRAACTCIDVSTPAWVSRCRSPGSSPSRGSTPARRIPCRLQRIVTRCRDCAPISFSLVSAERRETSLRESRLRSRVPSVSLRELHEAEISRESTAPIIGAR